MVMNSAGLDGVHAQGKGGAGRASGGGSGSDGVVRLKHLHASAAVEISAGEAERIRKWVGAYGTASAWHWAGVQPPAAMAMQEYGGRPWQGASCTGTALAAWGTGKP